jgi:lysozyme
MNPNQIGCDISSYQGTVDFGSIYNHAAFVIYKVTEGDSVVDPQFAANQAGARAHGFPSGGYHYAGGNNADDEADLFQNNFGTPKVGEWIILDWEIEYSNPDYGSNAPVGWCMNWFQRVMQDNGSVAGGILYIDIDRLSRYNWQPLLDWGVHIWVANPDNLPVPYPYVMQQFGEQNFPGISGLVDADFFHLPMSQFESLGFQFPTPPTPPTSAPTPPVPVPPVPVPPVIPTPTPPLPTPAPVPQPAPMHYTWWQHFLQWLKS